MNQQGEETTSAPIKRHLDLWIGILFGVGLAAALSVGQKIITLRFSLSTIETIIGQVFFTLTAAVLVVTHVYSQKFITWNKIFIGFEILVSLTVFVLAVWSSKHSFWPSVALAHLAIIISFTFLLFSLLVYAEAIFTQELREQRLIPLPTIGLQMTAIFLLLYVGRIIFPQNHIFLIVYLTLALFDMTSRVPTQKKNEKWEPLIS